MGNKRKQFLLIYPKNYGLKPGAGVSMKDVINFFTKDSLTEQEMNTALTRPEKSCLVT